MQNIKENTQIAPLMIVGGPYSGQHLLAALFEGHPGIISLPMWHDCIAAHLGLTRQSAHLEYNNPHLSPADSIFWQYLHSLDAFIAPLTTLQIAACAQKMEMPINSLEKVSIPLTFAYSDFLRGVRSSVLQAPQASLPEAFHQIMGQLQLQLKKDTQEQPAWGVSLMPMDFFRYGTLLDEMYPKGKCIFIYRDTVDMWATHIAAQNRHNLGLSDAIHYFCSNPHTYRTIKSHIMAKKTAHENPNQMLWINFLDLALKTKDTMQYIAEWLDLEYLPTLETPTFALQNINLDMPALACETADSFLSKEDQSVLQKYTAYFSLKAKQDFTC